MNKYISRWVALVALLPFASVLQAQTTSCEDESQSRKATIAELRDLQGNVLVSDKDGVSSAVLGQRVVNKARVTTTANAGVVVAFDCGCNVTLKENQRVDVELPRGCAALLAAVQSVPVTVALGSAGATSAAAGSTAGLLTVGAVGVGGYSLMRRNRNVSPN